MPDYSSLNIFFHNLLIDTLKLFGGLFFWVIPSIITIVNGYFIGFALIFLELGVGFIATGLGFKFGFSIFNRGEKFKDYFYNNIRIWFLIIIPILFISAFIENFWIYLLK